MHVYRGKNDEKEEEEEKKAHQTNKDEPKRKSYKTRITTFWNEMIR